MGGQISLFFSESISFLLRVVTLGGPCDLVEADPITNGALRIDYCDAGAFLEGSNQTRIYIY